MISTIQTLAARGWSERRIARELRLNRETVRRYSKHTTPSPGSEAVESSESPFDCPENAPPGASKYTTLSPGSEAAREPGPETIVDAALAAARACVSLCEPWKETIVASLEQQLSAKRIYQDLVRDHGFVGAYQSVKRYVRRLERAAPVPYRRMEFAPGEQMQVDFGLGAWIGREGERRRRPHVFRAVMCFSGKGYSEVVWNQKTETFLRCLENAFRSMGGVPATVWIDYVPRNISDHDPSRHPAEMPECVLQAPQEDLGRLAPHRLGVALPRMAQDAAEKVRAAPTGGLDNPGGAAEVDLHLLAWGALNAPERRIDTGRELMGEALYRLIAAHE
jgi:transposase